jgi:malate synthase
MFQFAQDRLKIPRGTIPSNDADQTILATFETEILYNCANIQRGWCGRWDYIFSFIKKFRNNQNSSCPTERR